MNSQLHEQVSRILASQPDPVSRQNLVDVVDLTEVSLSGDTLNLGLQFGYPINAVKEQLKAELPPLFAGLGAAKLNLKLDWKVKPALSKVLEGVGKVRNILAVASGKGGVGKS
ncbi:MAG TPA: hypothetical protein VM553_21760, partial [Dongiaceae bacterium]|nr:hypothetical protein [Dongiaceae bacterium]